MTEEPDHLLRAFYRGARPTMPIVPAARWRTWMNESPGRGANRCLPLLAGNEFGWFVLNERPLTVEWSGGEGPGALTVRYDGPPPPSDAVAHSAFGVGIVTFRLPYLFRTPPGWDLLVRGPTNWPKDGIVALDAVVETDWTSSSFTMNWKLTRPGSVGFDAGEPFCMLVPQRRRDLEGFRPEFASVETDPATAEEWAAFTQARKDLAVQKFLATFTSGPDEVLKSWQDAYFRGRTMSGRQAPEHITKRRLKPFTAGD